MNWFKKGRQAFYFWLMFLTIFLGKTAHVYAREIFVVKSANIKPYEDALNGFKSAVKGRIKVYELQADKSNAKQILSEIVSEQPDLIYTIGTEATILVGKNINKIPVVFSLVSNPERLDLNNSNSFGVSINVPADAQLGALKEVVKNGKRIGVLYNPNGITEKEMEQTCQTAQTLGLELIAQPVVLDEDVPNILRKLTNKVDVIWLIMDESILTILSIKHIMLTATRNKIPILSFTPRYIKDGALLAIRTDYFDMGVQAGELAVNIMESRSERVAAITPPRKLIPVINLKLAKFLGLEIDPQFLKKCEVYE